MTHFLRMNMKRSTIYDIIWRVDNKISLKQVSGQGRPAVKMTKENIIDLKKRVNGKTGVSQRKLALKYDITQPYVSLLLKKKNIRYFKRQNKPKVTEDQKMRQKKRLIKMSKNMFRPNNGIEVVMDDESYFPLSGHNLPGNDGYYTDDKSKVETDVKYRSKEKFPAKVMVWVAISRFGRSAPFFQIRGGTMDAKTYSKECLNKRLVPFLKKHHSDGQYILRPDGATAHYEKLAINAYNHNNIKYLKRNENPPNVPQLRPIEKFWAHLKRKVYANDWKGKNLSQLKSRIQRKFKDFSPRYFIELMSGCKSMVRKAADNGPEFMFN